MMCGLFARVSRHLPVENLIVARVAHQVLAVGRPVEMRDEGRVARAFSHSRVLLSVVGDGVHVNVVVARAHGQELGIGRVLNALDGLLARLDLREHGSPLGQVVNEPLGLGAVAAHGDQLLVVRVGVHAVQFVLELLGLNARVRERVPHAQTRVIAACDEARRRATRRCTHAHAPQLVAVALNHTLDQVEIKIDLLRVELLLIFC